jgi:hypothetical protein
MDLATLFFMGCLDGAHYDWPIFAGYFIHPP